MHAHVRFAPSGRSVRVAVGATLLDAIRLAGLPVASACGATALCGRCGVRVLAGGDALPDELPAEREAKRRNRVDPEVRLACQVAAAGDLEVTADYW
jgi:ferredoxin